ncbi:cyclin N-terminal domain-containing protein 1 isoform X1 [Petromyzon marinus]|uniref:cyclin N-terminal domain-containing protein 1 isoform X1 n=1 Tax=Petromyzon marinus TaxID=7757 RepID=UPI003F723F58
MEHAQTLPGETVFDGVTPAMLEEMLNSLAIETWQPSRPREPCEGAFGRERVAENIFLICEKLQLHTSVKYLAVELFDRYMLQQTKAQCDEWLKEKAAGSSDEINWEARLPDLKSELLLLLRMVSCVQIASKQMAHYKMVTLKPAQMLIQALSGSSIDLEQILSSEMAVLKALNYYINPASPLTHVDMIIAVLGHNDPTLPVKSLHSISLKVLDVVYLLRTAVYNDLLLGTSTGDALDPSDVTYRENFWRVEGDFMLLAVSVISAAAYFCCYPICQKVLNPLKKHAVVVIQNGESARHVHNVFPHTTGDGAGVQNNLHSGAGREQLCEGAGSVRVEVGGQGAKLIRAFADL